MFFRQRRIFFLFGNSIEKWVIWAEYFIFSAIFCSKRLFFLSIIIPLHCKTFLLVLVQLIFLFCLWLVERDNLTWILASDWLTVITCYRSQWYTIIRRYAVHFCMNLTCVYPGSAANCRDEIHLDTGLWLVERDHVTWIRASDWQTASSEIAEFAERVINLLSPWQSTFV